MKFELIVGSSTFPAIAYVNEVVDLRLSPSSMTILAGAATSYIRTLDVENNGNVDLQVGTLITKRKPIIIGPGQKLSVDIEFQLPTNLKPLRHYQANPRLH